MGNSGDIFAGLKLIAQPFIPGSSPAELQEPIDLADAKEHLKVPQQFTDEDDYINLMVTTARQECESILHRALLNQTWRLSLKNWPGRDYQNWPVSLNANIDTYYRYNFISLPYAAPLTSVDSLTYMDSSGTVRSMTPANFQVLPGYTYNVVTDFEPGRVVLPFSQIWPTDILMPGAPIQITYTCGYADVPTFTSSFEGAAAVIHAMKMMYAYWFENRIPPSEMRRSSINAGIQFVAEQMLMPYRIYE